MCLCLCLCLLFFCLVFFGRACAGFDALLDSVAILLFEGVCYAVAYMDIVGTHVLSS
uniref:Uncharacterized protein n=1 Tax=Oryza brachyantha TaxID=4533 RepID=J3NBZ5_ORYBR